MARFSFLPRRRLVTSLGVGMAALVLMPAGCSKSAAPGRPQRPQRPEADTSSGGPPAGATGGMSAGTIGVSLLTLDNPFFKLIGDTIAAKAREKTLYAQVVSADKDVAKQGNQVKDFIVRKVAAIVLSPCDSKAIGPIIAEANAAGIPVFTVDIPYRGSDAKVVTQIATDNFGGGKEAATAMIEALGAGGGKVAILHFKQAESCLLRVGGFRESIDAHNAALPAGHAAIEIIAELEAGGARDSGYKAAEDALQAHGDLRGIFAINDPSALGAVGALEKAGKTAQVVVVGFDGQPEGKEAIRDGKIYADPIQFPVKMGEQIVDAIVRHSKGEELPPEMFIPTSLYRKADAMNDPDLRPAGEPAPAN
ncbi:MAG: substrate-binding domain-containing protein [Planctomycetota bacterium]|nr:substrate-binding domain-containing protein [Planctomycetota bacterium]